MRVPRISKDQRTCGIWQAIRYDLCDAESGRGAHAKVVADSTRKP